MAFEHASAPTGQRVSKALSVDNAKPDRFTLMETLSRAASRLGLGPSVVATVDALLSCLPPKRTHDVVFASNATLVLRRNGISDRTLRRHLAELVALGLMTRIDSPNGKRYSKRDPLMGTALRFGLNLAPLFSAYDRLLALAQERAAEMNRANYLRTKLGCLVRHLANLGFSEIADEARRILRRQLSVDQLESCLTDLEARMQPLENITVETPLSTEEMSGSNGQNVRHQHNSKKENTDKEVDRLEPTHPSANRSLHLEQLTQACPEATSFLTDKLSSPVDVIAHARRLAPMIGIDRYCYETAERRLGSLETALTIWGLMERQSRIARLGAYFRSITSGNRSQSFDPWELINQLVRQASRLSPHCPRTTEP
ncbi:plasmid replication protein RepC [Tabrizicola oligotrophica]|uniref:Replication protein C n=1 Tax=Tabrizicola oligotrophica TaxID=2710650 RepID=A0A6M0QX23_9RHOB|nr:plasmid replication protein RepC [Tabrizicola oligotrophica]NEY92048.1 replication protein C [Tabrizicola oligotrophica]